MGGVQYKGTNDPRLFSLSIVFSYYHSRYIMIHMIRGGEICLSTDNWFKKFTCPYKGLLISRTAFCFGIHVYVNVRNEKMNHFSNHIRVIIYTEFWSGQLRKEG